MFRITTADYEIVCHPNGLPSQLSEYQTRATLSEDFNVADEIGSSVCFCSVGRPNEWPFLVVIQRYEPSGPGFNPGLLLVPETQRLFVGAGQRLLAYDLSEPVRLWEDQAEFGFWSWSQHGQVVIMAAELELAAWDITARKLWTRFVEPPWTYEVNDDVIHLDVMGEKSRLELKSGRPA